MREVVVAHVDFAAVAGTGPLSRLGLTGGSAVIVIVVALFARRVTDPRPNADPTV